MTAWPGSVAIRSLHMRGRAWIVAASLATAAATQPVPGFAQVADSAISRELRELYEADQADRQFSTAPTLEQLEKMAEGDRVRRSRVWELVHAGALVDAADYYHAAMVLQHGDGSEDILIAHILATVAAYKGDERGRWLSAAALDRYLHRTDQPQRLGTQYVRESADAPWTQGAYIDRLPDSIRREFGVQPLAEQKKRVTEMNAGSRAPAN